MEERQRIWKFHLETIKTAYFKSQQHIIDAFHTLIFRYIDSRTSHLSQWWVAFFWSSIHFTVRFSIVVNIKRKRTYRDCFEKLEKVVMALALLNFEYPSASVHFICKNGESPRRKIMTSALSIEWFLLLQKVIYFPNAFLVIWKTIWIYPILTWALIQVKLWFFQVGIKSIEMSLRNSSTQICLHTLSRSSLTRILLTKFLAVAWHTQTIQLMTLTLRKQDLDCYLMLAIQLNFQSF